MKSSKMLMLLVSSAVLFALSVPVFAASGGPSSIWPIICAGSERTTTVANTADICATALPANISRVDGYILNTSSSYLRCAFETTKTTGTCCTDIDKHYFYLYPSGDSYGRDRLWLSHDNKVYAGAVYFYGLYVDLATKAAASCTAYEWK